jgi:hypothetical protein
VSSAVSDEPPTFRTVREASEYLPGAATLIAEFARAHPGIVVHDGTVVVSRHTRPPIVSFMIWVPHSKANGCSVVSYDASRTWAEIIDGMETSLATAMSNLTDTWFDPPEEADSLLHAAAVAFAFELAVALDPREYVVPDGVLSVREGTNRQRARFTVTILAGDETYDVEEEADLTMRASQSAALVLERLRRRREKLLGCGG